MYRTNKKLKLSTSGDLCERKVFCRKENLDMVDSKTIYSGRQVKNIYDNDITHEYFQKMLLSIIMKMVSSIWWERLF